MSFLASCLYLTYIFLKSIQIWFGQALGGVALCQDLGWDPTLCPGLIFQVIVLIFWLLTSFTYIFRNHFKTGSVSIFQVIVLIFWLLTSFTYIFRNHFKTGSVSTVSPTPPAMTSAQIEPSVQGLFFVEYSQFFLLVSTSATPLSQIQQRFLCLFLTEN